MRSWHSAGARHRLGQLHFASSILPSGSNLPSFHHHGAKGHRPSNTHGATPTSCYSIPTTNHACDRAHGTASAPAIASVSCTHSHRSQLEPGMRRSSLSGSGSGSSSGSGSGSSSSSSSGSSMRSKNGTGCTPCSEGPHAQQHAQWGAGCSCSINNRSHRHPPSH